MSIGGMEKMERMSFERPLRLLATFSALELEINVQIFDTRFFIQKNGYLLQEFGADLGYTFGMYIHGPYSPALARDAYTLQDLEYDRQEIESVYVNTRACERMRAFMEDVDQLISIKEDRKYWLELLASLHFLCKYSYPKVKDLEDAQSQSKIAHFGNDIKQAFRLLRKHDLI
jgi:uncharacterized protein YwgA